MDAQDVHFPEEDLRIVGQTLRKLALAGDFDHAEAWCRVKSRKYGHVLQSFPVWYAKSQGARFARFRRLTEAICLPENLGLPGRVAHAMTPEWVEDVCVLAPSTFLRVDTAAHCGLHAAVAVPAVMDRVTRVVFVLWKCVPAKEDPVLLRTLTTIVSQFVRDHASPALDASPLAEPFKLPYGQGAAAAAVATAAVPGTASPTHSGSMSPMSVPQVVPQQAQQPQALVPRAPQLVFPAYPSPVSGFRPTGTDLLASAASMVARLPYAGSASGSSGSYSPVAITESSETAVVHVGKKHARDAMNEMSLAQRLRVSDVLATN